MGTKGYFVSGIGTEIGKTVVSAVLCKALGAAYFKPVQCGGTDMPEGRTIENLVPGTPVFPTTYMLSRPVSPHRAALAEGIEIHTQHIQLPLADRPLIVEGAGGLLVPLSDTETMANLAAGLGLPLILVLNHYLGSINHTLLSLHYIHTRKLPFAGIIFNGVPDPESERIIRMMGDAPLIGHVPYMEELTPEKIGMAADGLKIV